MTYTYELEVSNNEFGRVSVKIFGILPLVKGHNVRFSRV